MGNQAEPGLLPGPGGTVYRPLSRRDFLPFLFPIPEHLPRSRNPHETPFYLFEVPRTKSSPPPRVLRTPPGPTHANRNKRGGGPVMARPVVPTRQSTVLVSSLQHAMLRDTFPARYVGFTTSKASTLRRLCKHTAVSAHTTMERSPSRCDDNAQSHAETATDHKSASGLYVVCEMEEVCKQESPAAARARSTIAARLRMATNTSRLSASLSEVSQAVIDESRGGSTSAPTTERLTAEEDVCTKGNNTFRPTTLKTKVYPAALRITTSSGDISPRRRAITCSNDASVSLLSIAATSLSIAASISAGHDTVARFMCICAAFLSLVIGCASTKRAFSAFHEAV